MKKHLLLLLTMMMLGAGTAWGQGTETFTNIPTTTSSSYSARTWTGDDGGTWTAVDARTDQTINGKAILVRNGVLTSSTLSGGIGNLSVKTKRVFAGGSGNMDVRINGVSIGTAAYTDVEQTVTFNNINTSGSFTVVIDATNSAADRVVIDDLTWTAYAAPTTTTIANTGTPSASDIAQGTNDVVLFGFSLTPSASIDFTTINIATAGTATTDDYSNFELVYDADSDGIYDGGESVVSDTKTLANPLVFTMSGQTGFSTERRYLLIADAAIGATVGRTFTASIAAAGDVNTTGDESGTAAGNEQTIISATAPVITVTGVIEDFGNVAAGSNSSTDTFTVEGSNLTESVVINATSGFEVSTDGSTFFAERTLTQTDGTLDGEPVTITVRFSPSAGTGTTIGGNIALTSADATPQNIAVSGFAMAADPTTASNVTFTSVTSTSFTVNWTRGNGDSVLVVIKSGVAVSADPSNRTTYSANAAFGSGGELGTGNFVVFSGTDNSAPVTGLTGGITYHVELFEFKVGSAALTHNYNKSGTAINSQATVTPPSGLQISTLNTDFTISFDETLDGINNGAFTGTGFSPSPAVGQLDSDAWSMTGMSDGTVSFGATKTTGDFAKGLIEHDAVTRPVSGGTYAFKTDNSNTILGFQATSGDFNPGTLILKIQNNSGEVITKMNFSYLLWVLNNEGRSTSIKLSYSYDNTSYADVTELDFTTTEVADVSPIWKSYTKETSLYNLNISDKSFFYVRWSNADVAGAGSRDEFGIDDLTFNANSTTSRRVITGAAGWRMLSSPKTGFKVSDISDNTAIQGVAGGANSDKDANFYTYGSSGAWATPTNATTAVGNGNGFITYFYDNTTGGSSVLPITLDVSGAEPSSDVTVNINKTTLDIAGTNYYTLIGNPFASNIDLSNIITNEGTLNVNAQIWDNTSSDYKNVVINSGLLAPWQGFWVSVLEAETTTQITIPTTAKTGSGATNTYFKTVANQSKAQFSLSYDGISSSPVELQFLDEALVSNDRYDASKLTPLSASFSVLGIRNLQNNVVKAIEALPSDLSETIEFSLEPYIKGRSGEFTLSWEAFSSIPAHLNASLVDVKNNVTYDLKTDGSLSFQFASVEKAAMNLPLLQPMLAASSETTYIVRLSPNTTAIEAGSLLPTHTTLSQNFPNPFNPSTTISFGLPAQSQVRLTVFDMLGREVSVLVNGVKAAGNYELAFDASRLSSGMYIYRLEANGSVLTKKMTLIK